MWVARLLFRISPIFPLVVFFAVVQGRSACFIPDRKVCAFTDKLLHDARITPQDCRYQWAPTELTRQIGVIDIRRHNDGERLG